MPLNVLSLFGGCDSWYRYLLDAGHQVGKYYSAEVDKYAVKVAKANFPDIVELGDACQVGVSTILDPVYDESVHLLRCSWGETVVPGKIDLLMGWPPCQNYSRAGNRKGIDGDTWRLVLEFLRVFDETSPRWFFMENVPGMPEETQAIVSSRLGVPVRRIKASLLSSQNRDRLVWTNVPFEEPEDSGRVLLDDLEDVPFDAVDSKGEPFWKSLREPFIDDVRSHVSPIRSFGVLGCFTRSRGKQFSSFSPEKVPTVTSSAFIYNSFLIGRNSYWRLFYRFFTVTECARIQWLEAFDFSSVSKSQALKIIGNSWPRYVCHIFKSIHE